MDVLDRLEQKIRTVVAEMETLRQENHRLGQELDRAARGATGGEEMERLERQLDLLREERAAVRERVERLIGLLEEVP